MSYGNKSLTDYQQEIHRDNRERGWWRNGAKRSMGEVLMLIVTECAEAMEELRDKQRGGEIRFRRELTPKGYLTKALTHYEGKKPCGWSSELADIAIRLCDLAEATGVNLEDAMREKLEYNRTRGYRYGGKRA